jgi:hypothetical protein
MLVEIGRGLVRPRTISEPVRERRLSLRVPHYVRKTGFIFINKYDRSIAVRMLPHWDEIDAWRSSLSPARQGHLNNPKDIWEAYLEHRRKPGDPEAKERVGGGFKRKLPSVMEQMEALQQALISATDVSPSHLRQTLAANSFKQLAA